MFSITMSLTNKFLQNLLMNDEIEHFFKIVIANTQQNFPHLFEVMYTEPTCTTILLSLYVHR